MDQDRNQRRERHAQISNATRDHRSRSTWADAIPASIRVLAISGVLCVLALGVQVAARGAATGVSHNVGALIRCTSCPTGVETNGALLGHGSGELTVKGTGFGGLIPVTLSLQYKTAPRHLVSITVANAKTDSQGAFSTSAFKTPAIPPNVHAVVLRIESATTLVATKLRLAPPTSTGGTTSGG